MFKELKERYFPNVSSHKMIVYGVCGTMVLASAANIPRAFISFDDKCQPKDAHTMILDKQYSFIDLELYNLNKARSYYVNVQNSANRGYAYQTDISNIVKSASLKVHKLDSSIATLTARQESIYNNPAYQRLVSQRSRAHTYMLINGLSSLMLAWGGFSGIALYTQHKKHKSRKTK